MIDNSEKSQDMSHYCSSGFHNVRYVSLRLLWDCNLRCIMCDHPHRPKNEMTLAVAHAVLDQLTHPVRLTFIGGEPCIWLLRHPEILRRAFAEQHVVHMISNGLLVPKLTDFVDAFRSRKVSIQLSIDGFEKEYERIRKRSSWEKLTSVIRLLNGTRLQSGNTEAVITVNYLLMKSTLSSLPKFLNYCANEGIDSVTLTYAMIYDTMVMRGDIEESESIYYCKNEVNDAIQHSIEIATKLRLPLRYPAMIGEHNGSRNTIGPIRDTVAPGRSLIPHMSLPCDKPWKEIFVNQDGTIVPCCCGPKIGPSVGHIENGLLNVWNGEKIRDVRDALVRGKFHSDCKCGINISSVGRQGGAESFFTKYMI